MRVHVTDFSIRPGPNQMRTVGTCDVEVSSVLVLDTAVTGLKLSLIYNFKLTQ